MGGILSGWIVWEIARQEGQDETIYVKPNSIDIR